MAMRDRRGPLVALVLFVAYLLVLLSALTGIAGAAGLAPQLAASGEIQLLMKVCLTGLLWRMALRFVFKTREYGIGEGLRSVVRTPVANLIAIVAGRRAIAAYWRTLRGSAVAWDKTSHSDHPALLTAPRAPAVAAGVNG